MKAQSTFGIRFIIRKNKIKDGKVPVYASVTINGRRVEISMKHYIALEDWNSQKGQGRGMSSEVIQLNQYLLQVKSRLVEYYRQIQLQDQVPTAELLKNKFLGVTKERPTLLKLIEYHNKSMQGVLATGTLKHYSTTERYLKLYLKKKYKVQDYALADLSYEFITNFEYFLRTYKPVDRHKPIGNNTVMKHIERLRKMVTMGARMEWIEKDPFIHYKLKYHKTTREFLTAEELESIEKKVISIPRLQFVRDLFVFSCYTGLAYIDAVQLKPENISIGIDGENWISIHRQKSQQPVRIPILPKAQEIINTYKDHPRAINANRVFPNISNQKLNSYLKEIADLCGIRKPLTFHIARHTFATTVTLSNGVPLETVSKLLGHSSIQMTQVYAKIVEKKVSQDMSNLRKTLRNLKEGQNKNKTHII